jgi:hypothetical protein
VRYEKARADRARQAQSPRGLTRKRLAETEAT